MKKIELYSSKATQVSVHIPNLSEKEYEERFDEIIHILAEKDVNIKDLVDTNVDKENDIVNIFFLQDIEEVLVYSESRKDTTPDMRTGEYVIFTESVAKAFNEADVFGSKDFCADDEIKIERVSHKYIEDKAIIRYKLDTYVVADECVKIDLEDVSGSEVADE